MSMKVEKSTLDQVKKRFEFNKKAKEQKEKEYGVSSQCWEIMSFMAYDTVHNGS